MDSAAAAEPSLGELRAHVERLTASGKLDEATALAAASWRRWLVAGDAAGGRELLAAVLGRNGEASRDRATCLYADGLFLFRAGEQGASRARNEEALSVARAVGDPEAEALALVGLSRVAFRDGRHEEVVRLAAAARELARTAGPDAEAAPLHMEAAGRRLLGDYDRAADLYRESLALARSRGDARSVAMEQHNLGHVELHRGNVDAAAELLGARAAYAAGSEDPYEQAMTALNAAALAAARGDEAEAREHLRATRRRLDEAAILLDPDDDSELAALTQRLR